MADTKVSALTAPSGGVASGDKLYVVDVSDTTDGAGGSSRADTVTNVVSSVAALKANNLSDLVSASTARTNLGLGSVATKAATSGTSILAGDGSGGFANTTPGVDYYNPGGTDVAVADGGTGASTAANARTNLGLVIGTNVVAPNQDTTGKSAKTDALNSASTVVNVSSATAPSSGQVLTATSSTAATWQAPASGGVSRGQIVATASGLDNLFNF